MHTSTTVTVVHSELRYPQCKPDFCCKQRIAHAFLTPLMKNTVGAFDWFLFRVLDTGPRKFKPSTRTSGIGAFRECHGAMLPAGHAVVVDYRTHLHVIQSNAPKLIRLHPPLFILAKLLLLDIPRLLGRPTKVFLYYLLETAITVRPFSIKVCLNKCFLSENRKILLAAGASPPGPRFCTTLPNPWCATKQRYQ